MISSSRNTIKFLIIIIALSALITMLIPKEQKISIPLLPQYKVLYLNDSFIKADNLFFNKTTNVLKTYNANIFALEDYMSKISLNDLIEEVFYNEAQFFVETLFQNSINDSTGKEKYFFKNSIYTTSVIINPEDGKAINSTPTLKYAGKKFFNKEEIDALNKKIERNLSKLFFEKYTRGLEELLAILDKIITPNQLKKIDQKIEVLNDTITQLDTDNSANNSSLNPTILKTAVNINDGTIETLLQVLNQIDKGSLEDKYYQIGSLLDEIKANILLLNQASSQQIRVINEKVKLSEVKNLKKNFLAEMKDVKSSILLRLDKNSNSLKTIDYFNTSSFSTKANLKLRSYYMLLVILNVLILSIYVIFFRHGLSYFIKNYIEEK